MRSVTFFLLIFVAILATNAGPTEKKKTFRLPLKRSNTTALYRRKQGSVPAKYETPLFTVNVGVGTPPQMFDLVVNTGYPHTVIADAWCGNCGNPAKIPEYNGSASSSYKDLATAYSAVKNLLRGAWTSENFQIPVFSMDISFVRCTKVLNSWVARGEYSGFLGLGLHNSSPFHTFIEDLMAAKSLDTNVISCRFTKDPQNPGEVLFGAIDQQHIDGDLTTVPILNGPQDAQWLMEISDLQINDMSIASGTGYLDTGVEFVYLPSAVVEALYADTGAQNVNGVWAVPDPFPYDVSFTISDTMFTIAKADIPQREFPKYGDLYRGAFQIASDDYWGLGLPFITNYYVVFDFGNNNVEIGKQK